MHIDISKHDRWQLEIKLLYEKAIQTNIEYEMSVWFVLHPSIGIEPRNYAKNDFFKDCRGYTRLSIPRLTLEELLEESSPLFQIMNSLRLQEKLNVICGNDTLIG